MNNKRQLTPSGFRTLKKELTMYFYRVNITHNLGKGGRIIWRKVQKDKYQK